MGILMKKIVKGKNIQLGQINYQTDHSNLDKGGIISTSELVNKLEAQVEEVVEGVINKSMSIFQKTLLERFDSFTKDIKKLVKNDATQNQFMPTPTNEHHVSNRKLQTHSLDKQISNVLPTEEKKFNNDLELTATNTDEDSDSKINDNEENVTGATQLTSMKREKNSQSQNSANKNQTDDTFLVKGENGKSVLRQNQTDQDNLKLQENPKEAAEDNTAKETKPGSLDPEGVDKIQSSKSDVNDVKPTATEKKSKVVQLKQNFQKTMTQQNQKDQDNISLQKNPNKESLEPEGANKPTLTNSNDKTKENALEDKVPEKKPKQASLVNNIKANFDKSTDNVMKIQPGQTNYFNVPMFIVLGLVFGIFFGMKYKSKQRNSRQYRYRNLSSHLSDTRHSDDEEDSELFKQFIATKLK